MKYLPESIRRFGIVCAKEAHALLGLRVRALMALAAMACISFAAFANESASLMTFSTVGPDCYADGSQVLDGEYYALVYQTDAAGEVLFTHSGEIANVNAAGESISTNVAQILRALPRAKNGCCPSTTFSVLSTDLPKLNVATGLLRLYLLDTRVYENGAAKVGGLNTVQASVPVTATCKITTTSTSGSVSGDFSSSLLPLGIDNPKITDIEVADGFVTLTVEDTVEGVNYTSEDPFANAVNKNATPVTGKTGVEVKLVIPQGDSQSGFYRVKRQ